jgi:hypothetical protein
MKYAIIAAAILLAATSIADAKQWGRGNRPAPGIGRCGSSGRTIPDGFRYVWLIDTSHTRNVSNQAM